MIDVFFLFLLWVSTLGYALAVAEILDVRPETGPAFTIFAQMVILYIASLVGGLQIASYILAGLGWVALIVLLWKHRRGLRTYLGAQATPGLVFFFLLIPILWLSTRTWQFAKWDEFSHWGLIFKAITQSNQLPGVNTALLFPDYPPGTALYQYFIASLLGVEEGSAYFAQGLMVLAPLVALAQGFGWKKWHVSLGIFVGGFLLFHMFGYSLNIIYVDGLLGVVFGTVLAFGLTEKTPDRRTLLYLLPMLMALPLIKKSGIFFAISAGMLAVAWVVLSRQDRLAWFKRWAVSPVRQKANLVLPAAALTLAVILGPLLMMSSWNLHFSGLERLAGKQLVSPVNITINQLYNSFVGLPTARDTATVTAFVRGLQSTPFGKNGDLTTRQVMAAFLMVILLAGLTLYNEDSELKRRFLTVQGLTLICVLVYFTAILISYLYIFSEYEGTRIASFDRYIGSGLLGWGLLILAFLAVPLRRPHIFSNRARSLSLLFLGISILVLFLKTPIENYLYPPQVLRNGRQQIFEIVRQFKPKIVPGSYVYDIWQNSTGIEHLMTRYELYPIRVEAWSWSLGEPYTKEDVWTVNITPADWMAQLQREGFNYVLVSQPDEIFWDRYGSLFQNFTRNGEPQLFRVTSDGLVRVPG